MKALYLEPDEEITSVVDRLSEVDDAEVAIVVPKRAGLLQSIVNLKLLKHQGEQLGKQLSIVTTDKTGRNLASAVGLTVYQKLPDGSKVKEAAVKDSTGDPVPITFRKRPGKAAETPSERPRSSKRPAKLTTQAVPDEPVVPPTPPVRKIVPPDAAKPVKPEPPSEPKAPREPMFKMPNLPKVNLPVMRMPELSGRRRLIAIIGVVVAVVLVGSGVAAATLPQAEVTITPKTNPFSADVPVTFSVKATSPDFAGKVLPAKTIEATKQTSVTVNATGSKESGGKATGAITVVSTLSKAQPLVAKTRFQAPDGRIYRAQSAITVPASGQTKVTVVADDGGEAGNLAAGTRLSIPGLKGDAVYGQADEALTGGTNSATPEVSQGDVDRGRNELAAKAAKEGLDEVKSKVPVGSKINDQVTTTNIASVSVNPPVGAQAAEFTLIGTVRVVYFSYVDADLQKLIGDEIKPKIPAGDDLVAENTQQIFTATQPSSDKLTGVFKINSSTTQELSRDQIKHEIAGKSPSDAEKQLKSSGKVGNVSVKLSPFWVTEVPKSENKIKIRYAGALPSASPSPLVSPLPTKSGTPQPQI